MAYEPQDNVVSRAHVAEIDAGLRTYMLSVYNYMTGALVVTGLMAYIVMFTSVGDMFMVRSEVGGIVYGLKMLGWVAFLAPIGLVFFISFRINNMQVSTAQTVFWVYATLMGISLAPIVSLYTGASVARVFFITAATFASMSLYGYTTKRDLSGFGSFLMMGLIGIIIASLVNIFVQSNMMTFIISVAGVLVFTGLTAYDTQKIKESYVAEDGSEITTKKAIMGALNLYLDFINLFIMLLRLIGDRR